MIVAKSSGPRKALGQPPIGFAAWAGVTRALETKEGN